MHEAAHTEPEGPLPVVFATVTQHNWPFGQSADFVQVTIIVLAQNAKSFGVHVLLAGQQARGVENTRLGRQCSAQSHTQRPATHLST
jgi:hypothetical protein